MDTLANLSNKKLTVIDWASLGTFSRWWFFSQLLLLLYAMVAPSAMAFIDNVFAWELPVCLWSCLVWILTAGLAKLPLQKFAIAQELSSFITGAVGAAMVFLALDTMGIPADLTYLSILPAGLANSLFVHIERQRLTRLDVEIVNAKLHLLQARIQPHFLFNTLNTAIACIRSRPSEAEGVLIRLSDLFREVISEKSMETRLSRDISLTQAYLHIEQYRIGNKLQVTWDVADDVDEDDPYVPSLLLQPLLENAVRYGVREDGEITVIDVCISKRLGRLIVSVKNPIAPGKLPGNGIALRNLQDRLSRMYDNDTSLNYIKGTEYWQISIEIPYVLNPRMQ